MRLKRFSLFDSEAPGASALFERYFDRELNEKIFRKVAGKCYLPANSLMLELLEKYPEMKVSYSLTGVFIDQCEMFGKDVLESFCSLAKTGRVDFLNETYYHSLSSLFKSKLEFFRQVEHHRKKIEEVFGVKPKVFRNTEALFSNEIAALAEGMGYSGIMTEGIDHVLNWRSPNYPYSVKGCQKIRALLRNYKLSDDVGYRFSEKKWNEYPLTAEKYAKWLSSAQGDCVNIFMDYETFGEHHWADTGIFDFLRHLPSEMKKHPNLRFATPSEVASHEPKGEIDVHNTISWADMERDTSAWLGNEMQQECFSVLEGLEQSVLSCEDKNIHRAWRLLQNSDHLYYLSTKSLSDQDVHNYFSPYESPFEGFINFMNILQDLKKAAEDASPPPESGSLGAPVAEPSI